MTISPSSEGEAQRDHQLDLLAQANLDWIALCVSVIRGLPRASLFCTDQLWEYVNAPLEPRAMGAAIVEARRRGLIKPTGVYRRSTRKACNARPVLLWRRL